MNIQRASAVQGAKAGCKPTTINNGDPGRAGSVDATGRNAKMQNIAAMQRCHNEVEDGRRMDMPGWERLVGAGLLQQVGRCRRWQMEED